MKSSSEHAGAYSSIQQAVALDSELLEMGPEPGDRQSQILLEAPGEFDPLTIEESNSVAEQSSYTIIEDPDLGSIDYDRLPPSSSSNKKSMFSRFTQV